MRRAKEIYASTYHHRYCCEDYCSSRPPVPARKKNNPGRYTGTLLHGCLNSSPLQCEKLLSIKWKSHFHMAANELVVIADNQGCLSHAGLVNLNQQYDRVVGERLSQTDV